MATHDLSRSFYGYTSDDTTVYQVGTTNQNGATVNGATPTPAGTNPTYPRGWKMRKVYGKAGSGAISKVPIFDPGNGLWLGTTASFTKDGVSYTVQGKIGEKRENRGG